MVVSLDLKGIRPECICICVTGISSNALLPRPSLQIIMAIVIGAEGAGTNKMVLLLYYHINLISCSNMPLGTKSLLFYLR